MADGFNLHILCGMTYTCNVYIDARNGRKKVSNLTITAKTTMEAVKYFEKAVDAPVLSVEFI